MSGNLWMFSDMLDDEDIEILKHEFITYYQGADYYGVGLKMFTRLAHEAGAIYKLGKKVLVRRTILEEYLRKIYRKEQEVSNQKDTAEKKNMKIGTLVRNMDSGRMDVRLGLNEFLKGLRCGTRMDVLIDENWIPTRIEMADDCGVSKTHISEILRKMAKVLAAQGFSCCTCPQVQYKLLPLSECKESIIVPGTMDGGGSARFLLSMICRDSREVFRFEVRLEKGAAK